MFTKAACETDEKWMMQKNVLADDCMKHIKSEFRTLVTLTSR